MFAYEAMSTNIVTAEPGDTAAHAADMLIERDVTGLPVIDDLGHVLGIVTDLDLIRAVRDGTDLQEVTVADVMDARPLFVEPNMDLYTVVDLMEEWQVRRLPVCEDGRVVGIVSRGDVLRVLRGAPPRPPAANDG